MFAGDIPQCNVDGADGAHDGGAAKVAGAVHVLPVVLDAEWVLTNQVASELTDNALGALQIAPRTCLTQARDAFIGVDLDKQVVVYRQRVNSGYLNGLPPWE